MEPARPRPELEQREADDEHRRIWREGTTMVLYLAIVLLATLAVLPAGHTGAEGEVQGPTGLELVAIIWGTTVGLALAHLFAFRVASHGFGGGRLQGEDLKEAVAQLIGAVLVATLASLPVLLFRPVTEQRAVLFVLVLIIGGADYAVERVNGRSRARSAALGVGTLLIAVSVAAVKIALSGH